MNTDVTMEVLKFQDGTEWFFRVNIPGVTQRITLRQDAAEELRDALVTALESE